MNKSRTTPLDQSGAENQTNTPFIVLISVIATIGGFLFGFDSGVINGTVDGLRTAFNINTAGRALTVNFNIGETGVSPIAVGAGYMNLLFATINIDGSNYTGGPFLTFHSWQKSMARVWRTLISDFTLPALGYAWYARARAMRGAHARVLDDRVHRI